MKIDFLKKDKVTKPYKPGVVYFETSTGLIKVANTTDHCDVFGNTKSEIEYYKQYLTFETIEDSTFTFSNNDLQYSLDNGATWTTLEANVASPEIAAGSKVLWKQTDLIPDSSTETPSGIGTFSSTGKFRAYGNIMSLYYGDDFIEQVDLSENKDIFSYLFYNNTKLLDASNLVLPAKTLTSRCYQSMFHGCTSLVIAPELPATLLGFACYQSMFQGCTSLVIAPELPATTLSKSCYYCMFKGCTSLTSAPDLLANRILDQSYIYMFQNCTSLNYIKCLATNLSGNNGTSNWAINVSSTGTFIKADNVSWNTGTSGIPSGWASYTKTEYEYARKYELPSEQIQSDWNQTDTDAKDFIKNKPTNVSSFTNDANYATQTDVSTAIANIVNSAPSTLDTLNELADALGNDANFATTVSNQIGSKYTKPSGGIPSEDLSSDVQTNLAKAASALQVAPVTSVNGMTGDITINLEEKIDYSKQYLTFEAIEDTTFTFSKNNLQYSLDNGETWVTLKANTASPTITIGNKIIWKQIGLISTSYYSYGIGTFSSTGNFKAYGNIMSLCYGDDFNEEISLSEKNYAFYKLFYNNTKLLDASNLVLPAITLSTSCYSYMFSGCTSLTSAPELPATTLTERCYEYMFCNCTSLTSAPELPATTLASNCYYYMFSDCTSLTSAPELPAIALAYGCYAYMFYNCTSLTSAPELPATTLASNCYYYMFSSCTSLTSAPELPAIALAYGCYAYMFYNCTSLTYVPKLLSTTLDDYCYYCMFECCTSLTSASELPATKLKQACYGYMFYGCTSLTSAPELPATTLSKSCYRNMFEGCTSLTSAPELPATTLASNCYDSMFEGCTSLNYIKCRAIDISASECTKNLLKNVGYSGIFVKNNHMNSWTTGDNGIPSHWNVYIEDDYKEIKKHEFISLIETFLDSYITLTQYETLDEFIDEEFKSTASILDNFNRRITKLEDTVSNIETNINS